MSRKLTIAIDGPAGAGKSTIAKIIAKKLGIIYIDTGAMYRAVALAAIRKGIDTKDREKVAKLIKEIDISIQLTEAGQVIFLGDENVNELIRTPEVSVGSSDVAVVPEVREKMVEIQRQLADINDVVMDGRDIGTHVLPKADLKIFLTASVEERAKRRYNELMEKGNCTVTVEEVRKDIKWRDSNDTNRKYDPLKPADDAKVIDATDMSIEQVTDIILEEVKRI